MSGPGPRRRACPPGRGGSSRAAAYCQRLQRWLTDDEPVSSLGLQSGDRLVISPEGPLPTRESKTSADEVPFRLAVVGGPDVGLRVGLAAGEHLLGRTPGCTVQIDDPSLSGEHIRMRVSSDGVRIADAGSSNGTFLEGEAVEEERPVEPGQLVRAGRSSGHVRAPRAARANAALAGRFHPLQPAPARATSRRTEDDRGSGASRRGTPATTANGGRNRAALRGHRALVVHAEPHQPRLRGSGAGDGSLDLPRGPAQRKEELWQANRRVPPEAG